MGKALVSFGLLAAALSSLKAQDQERNLIDRLLRPDMRLQNAAQNKKFIAANGIFADKRATTGTFYVRKQSTWSREKFQRRPRDFSTWQFSARSFHGGDHSANVSSRQQTTDSKRSYSTQTAQNLRNAYETSRTVDTGSFAGSRPFLGQGKSQKSLNRRNSPLTIEQVRELLNKNK